MQGIEALIAVAGYGTRRLPWASVIEKCMAPVGDYPVVHYVVAQCVEAGITDITFVVGDEADQLRKFYSEPKAKLRSYLQQHSKTEKLDELMRLAETATFRFIEQKPHRDGYGTAVPLSVWLDREAGPEAVGKDQVLYVFGDQFLHNADGSNEIERFLRAANTADTRAAMLAVPVDPKEVYKYGIVSTTEKDGKTLYQNIVEKPAVGEAPTNLINGSHWLLDKSDFQPFVRGIMDGSLPRSSMNPSQISNSVPKPPLPAPIRPDPPAVTTVTPDGPEQIVTRKGSILGSEARFGTGSNSELMITDAANAYVASGREMLAFVSKAELLDCGTREGAIRTNLIIGQAEGWYGATSKSVAVHHDGVARASV